MNPIVCCYNGQKGITVVRCIVHNMNEFDVVNGTLMGYHGNDSVVIIPQEVTRIHWFGIRGSHSVNKVVIPEGVHHISDAAFMSADIEEIVLPAGIRFIGENAFAGSRLRSIQIPQSIRTIRRYTFFDCRYLMEIILSDGLELIDCGAFSDCRNLSALIIPASVKYIGQDTFRHCYKLSDIVFLGAETEINESAFEPLKNLVITAPRDSLAIHFARKYGYRYKFL